MRERLLMDRGWKFHRGDVTLPAVHPALIIEVYRQTKSQRGRGPAAEEYDDTDWRTVDLPHDYAVEGTPDPDEPSAAGSLARPNAWYRRYFRLPESARSQRVTLTFDGIATHANVWVNGHLMARHFGGYMGFAVDMTDVARFGDDENVVSVFVHNEEPEGWWYEGAGIYRHVWLTLTDPVHVARCGVYVTNQAGEEDRWTTRASVTVENESDSSASVAVRARLMDDKGCAVAEALSAPREVAAGESAVFENTLCVERPALWLVDSPNLYRVIIEVLLDGDAVDRVETVTGFRTLAFSPEEGFFLNGRPMLIKGVCAHQDFGGEGIGQPDSLKRFRIRQLKAMGCNAYRTAHNPPSPEFLRLCDEEGLLVMDENRWFESYGEGLAQLEDMIRRDRNHPCVVFWSLGNEEPVQGFETGRRIFASMKKAVKRLDDTRPLLMAMHNGLMNGQAAAVCDVLGVNYNEAMIEAIHARNPDKPMIGSENYSLSDEPEANRALGIETWRLVKTLPYMSGCFIWTGIDYRGEHRYPTVLAACGALDINCLPRDDFYAYQAYWKDGPTVRLCPKNAAPPEPGETLRLGVYSNAEMVELFVNGRLAERRAIPEFDLPEWVLPYEPGEWKAVAMNGGRAVAEHTLHLGGAATALKLTLLTPEMRANGRDAALIVTQAVDAAGNPVPWAEGEARFEVLEGGRLSSTCSGAEDDHVPCPAAARKLHRGRCAAVVRLDNGRGADVELTVRVTSPTLEGDTLVVALRGEGPVPEIPPVSSGNIRGFMISSAVTEAPDWEAFLREGPDDTFKPTAVGVGYQPEFFRPDAEASFERYTQYARYYAKTRVPDGAGGADAVLRFEEVEGKLRAAVRVSGRLYEAQKPAGEVGRLDVPVPGLVDGAEAEIFLLMGADTTSCGLMRPVHWRHAERGGKP